MIKQTGVIGGIYTENQSTMRGDSGSCGAFLFFGMAVQAQSSFQKN